MTILATNLVGEYGVPGVGVFAPGETREVPMEVAARLRSRPEFFKLTYDLADLPLRGADGRVNRLGYFGPVDARFGYGGAGITILRALSRLGVEAAISPHYNNGHDTVYGPDLPAEVRAQVGDRPFIPQATLVHCLPDDLPRCDTPRKIAWTMWETTRIPHNNLPDFGDWAALLNRHAERLIVPCEHNAEVFRDCGVTLPTTVLPYGLDTDIWPYHERGLDRSGPFLVVQYGDLTTRKGPEEAVDAFKLAFGNQDDVRLILKTQGGVLPQYAKKNPKFHDPRVHIVSETWSRARLVELLHLADCFIWLSRGEGFGLPPLQAALTGLPVVMTTHTGMGAYYRPQFFYGVQSSGLAPCRMGGDWYEPDVEHAASQLRKVYEDRKAAQKRGKAAATYVRNNFSLDAFAERLGTYLDTL